MPTIHLTDHSPAVRNRPATRALAQAAVAAQRAPSIVSTQPWRWRIHDESADLVADREQPLSAADPDGRMLTVSCGIALHHACAALAGTGAVPRVDRLPDPSAPDLVAVVRVAHFGTADPEAVRLLQAIAMRGTDRRPNACVTVSDEVLDLLCAAAGKQGAHLRLLRREEVGPLAGAADRAADREGARYALLVSDTDDVPGWLAAGEALSAVLLTATGYRLGASPVSEVPGARRTLYGMLGGEGHPVLALRLGVAPTA